jgi:hypothetical protein
MQVPFELPVKSTARRRQRHPSDITTGVLATFILLHSLIQADQVVHRKDARRRAAASITRQEGAPSFISISVAHYCEC